MKPNPAVLLLALAAMALSGCGGAPFGYVPVSGKVTYEDGSLIPAEQLRVTFVPQSPALDEKTHPRPGTGEVNVDDGTFNAVTSYKYGDGILRGRHKVLLEAFDADLNSSGAVPPQYTDPETTPLEVDAADSPFDLKIAKPASTKSL